MNLGVGGGNKCRLDQGGVRGKIEDEYDHNVLDTNEILKEWIKNVVDYQKTE